jgi:hypothetical protein
MLACNARRSRSEAERTPLTVEADIDGNGAADFSILLLNVTSLAMSDFVL